MNSDKKNIDIQDTTRTKGNYFDRFKPNKIEAEKKRLKQIENNLQTRVEAFIRKHCHEEISVETIEEGSKKINECEANFGLYLSYLQMNEKLSQRHPRLRQAKTLYMEKLSLSTATWLRQFAPHIVDITSYNRAKGLAETLVRIYQCERQEIFMTARSKLDAKVPDTEILESLRECLEFCYDWCRDCALGQSLVVLEQLTLCSENDIKACSPVLRLLVRELQELTASYTLPHLQETIRQEVKSQTFLRPILKYHHMQKPPLSTFVDLCIEVSWFTQFQDPPVVLDFTGDDGKKKFAPYTKGGQEVDFVVWPAVLLHEDGMIVSRGIAEYRDGVSPNLHDNT